MSGSRPRIHPRSQTRRRLGLVLWLGVPLASVASAAGFAWALSAHAAPQPQATPPSPAAAAKAQAAATPRIRTHAEDVAELVGSSSCRECHPGEAAAHSGSGHARTLRKGGASAIVGWLNHRTVKDPELPDVTWTYEAVNGRLEVERQENGKFACYPLDLAVGSGANGVTFLTLRAPTGPDAGATGVEHRLSLITAGTKRMEVTPGQGKGDSAAKRTEVSPHGRTLDEQGLTKCVRCHATLTSAVAPDRVDRDALIPNVSCERCHGPARAHVEHARKGDPDETLRMPLGLDDNAPARLIQICGECHRTTSSVSPSMVDPRNHEIARFQPLGLEVSRCFQNGKSGLSCTSCHDPHAKVSRGERAYENVCLKCHSPAHRKTCPVSATEGCINCHMPKRTVSEVFTFTDHWIRRPDPEESAKK